MEQQLNIMKIIIKNLEKGKNVTKINRLKEIIIILASILITLIGLYVFTGLIVDYTARHISIETENKIFKLLYMDKFKNIPIEKSIQEEKLQILIDNLAQGSEFEKRKLKIYLQDSNVPNAYAVVGNSIYLLTAMLEVVESENELAWILAHELGHFKNRDHLKKLGRGLVLSAISVSLFGADSTISKLIKNIMGATHLSFNQKRELSADKYGLFLLFNHYGHVNGAQQALEKFLKLRKDKKTLFSNYNQTHPHPETRIKKLLKEIKLRNYKTEGNLLPIRPYLGDKKAI